MFSTDLLDRYFDAWNRHSGDALAACFATDGSYTDPAAGRLGPDATAAYLGSLVDAFPDLRIEVVWSAAVGDRWVVEWVLTGTNSGAFGGAPPTGRGVRLPGIEVLSGDGPALTSVVGYFDQRTLVDQLGLQVLVQPHQAGPFEFGRAVRVRSGEDADLGAVSLTWIDVDTEDEEQTVSGYSRELAAQMTQMPGCLGWLGIVVGRRMYTVTGWRDAESAAQLRRTGTHRQAVQDFFRTPLGRASQTGVWVPDHVNTFWRRCPTCGELRGGRTAEACSCGARWSEPVPAF